ncbi:11320_t:CDS:2 [Dentiscutata erythropus]|uniref:Kinetochore protein SPC25 n=1 Tax=Dentiscutata erythropus TaxID=1348616 RepID=A0A9N8WHV3_9GLOM|nr:11320_t:CDS:2 [Dentiscutata erythropus]
MNSESTTPNQSPKFSKSQINISFSNNNTQNKNVINDTFFSFTKVDYDQENLKKNSKPFEENLNNYIVNAKKNMESKRQLWQNTITNNKGIIVLKKITEKVEEDIKQQREAIEVKRALLETQLSRNLPELSIFTNKLALTMESVRDDVINFTFTSIYDDNSSRSCYFTIDVGETKYKVIECNPMVEELDKLVSQLNTSRDFFSFLKKMRQEFRKNAKVDI